MSVIQPHWICHLEKSISIPKQLAKKFGRFRRRAAPSVVDNRDRYIDTSRAVRRIARPWSGRVVVMVVLETRRNSFR